MRSLQSRPAGEALETPGPNTLAFLEARVRWLRAHPEDKDAFISETELATRLRHNLDKPWPPIVKAFVCDLLVRK